LNWTPRQKALTLLVFSNIALITAFNTAVFEPATAQIAEEFGVSREIATLGTTLNLIGGGTFPLLFAPLSELYGRKWTVVGPAFIAACFAFACGASKDLQSILITRFFQGGFGGAVTANLGGILGDIYSPQQRGAAMVLYSTCVVAGPLTAPIIGSAVVTSHLGWRWTMFLVGIFQVHNRVGCSAA
jgi:MFS family permease